MQDESAVRKKTTTADRLRRLLNLVPVLAANPGIRVKDLVPLSGYKSAADLRADLTKLMMIGTPPLSPADFFDVLIDEEDRVTLDLAQGLDTPLALEPEEWLAVHRLLTREISYHAAGRGTTEALQKVLEGMSSVPVSFEQGEPAARRRSLVEEALQDELQIEFRYKSLAAREAEIRRIDPWALFQHRGSTYVVGYCHLRRAPRHFHLERMEDVEILDVEQEQDRPENLEEFFRTSLVFADGARGFRVKIQYDASVAPALAHRLSLTSVKPIRGKEDWSEAECRVQDSLWFRATIRSLGPHVVIVEPAHLRKSFVEDLEAIPLPGVLP